MFKKALSLAMMFLCVMVVIFGSSITAHAESKPSDYLTDTTVQDGSQNVSDTTKQLKVLGVSIHTLITTALNIVGLIVLAVYGGKWWLAGKDSTKKKELKEEGVNYVIGSLIFFGAAFIYDLLHKLSTGFSKKATPGA